MYYGKIRLYIDVWMLRIICSFLAAVDASAEHGMLIAIVLLATPINATQDVWEKH